ncbi:helix-turn-helix transcriptional regulator [Streptomyces sp. NPDC047082]|uniref:helix-turn-helix domain-containing protein n=1 Tax=Streptomyces sp. NPDC047082 TaxID=3155259 RepID=UPI0033DC116C
MRSVQPLPAGQHHAALAIRLEELRQRAQLTFADLAERIAALGDPDLAVSAATLKRASGCRTLPKETTVVAYVRGCGGTPEQERGALRLWARARAKDRGVLQQLRAPSVENIRTHREFTAALAAVYESAGAPPLRTLQQRAGTVPQAPGTSEPSTVFVLPLGTLWRIVNRRIKLPDWKHSEAFLRGCGITGQRALKQWKQAWTQASTARDAAPAHSRRPGRGSMGYVPDRRHFAPVLTEAASTALGQGLVWEGGTQRFSPQELDATLSGLQRHLASARRNGMASDTGIDGFFVSHQGTVHLVQMNSDFVSRYSASQAYL